MKKWKKILVVFLVFGIISIGTLSWYAGRYSMEPVAGFEVNSDTLSTRVLIATQGSEFKDAVVAIVIETLKAEPIYFKVIDVALLPTVSNTDWDAIVILHTWEYSEPPVTVRDFVSETSASGKIMVVTTSGSGAKMEGVDGVSSASATSEQADIVRSIVHFIERRKK